MNSESRFPEEESKVAIQPEIIDQRSSAPSEAIIEASLIDADGQ
jgi:hypothetical protein